MKRLVLVAGGLLLSAGAALFLVGELSGEVAVLHTRTADGTAHRTRLWVVEHEGAVWLRAGSRAVGSESSWYASVLREPLVELERAGIRHRYRAVPMPEAREVINSLGLRPARLSHWVGARALVLGSHSARSRAGAAFSAPPTKPSRCARRRTTDRS